MVGVEIKPIPTAQARVYWQGGADAHGLPPERHLSDGTGVPCRHCLESVAAGEAYLILAHCPFPKPQPYAEVGPIFLHAEPCDACGSPAVVPATYLAGEPRIVRGYDRNDRIVYGTGKVVPAREIAAHAAALLEDPATAYVHVRSSLNNCFAFRIDRTGG